MSQHYYKGKDGNFYPVGQTNNNQNNSNNNQEQFKTSGATFFKLKYKNETENSGDLEGMWCCNAWRKTKAGLMTASAMPYVGEGRKGLEPVFSYKGEAKEKEYQKVMVKITMNGQISMYPCLMNVKTKTIVIKELSLVISDTDKAKPTRSGKMVTGYFGRNFKK